MFSMQPLLRTVGTILALTTYVSALGTSCTAPLGAGTSGPNDPFWMQNIKHQGKAPLNSFGSGYTVFRSVKDYGAVGDGVHDDTSAINAAISAQGRCGIGCDSSTTSPAIVYFPQGTYLVSAPIIPYYYTQLIGDGKVPPTLLASASFSGMAVIDADPYIPGGGGSQYWVNQDNFFRSIRNFVIDVRQVPATNSQGTGIHWQVSQATSLINIVVQMSTASNTAHQGIWMENGSGGYMGDLVFNGGKFGIWGGNQQFTLRNVTVNNAQTGIYALWNWGWTYQGVNFNNCQVGFDIATGGLSNSDQTAGALAIIDSVATNTPIFARTSKASNGALGGSIVLNNVKLNNVPVAVGVVGGATVLAGGTTTIASWGQGNVFKGTSGTRAFTQGNIPAPSKAGGILDGNGRIVGRTHPQYAAYAASQFVSVRDHGAVGDGVTDDTAAITNILNTYSGCKIIFFDAGIYVVSSTITIPAGTQMVGEAWTVLAAKGAAFQNQNSPSAVFKVGATGSQGILEITDILFTTIGPAAGAILLEWNVHDPAGTQAAAGMWDSHIRLGGAAGTNLQGNNCPSSGSGGTAACSAAFLSLHLTTQATAYIEGTWIWLADHDMDTPGNAQVSLYSGRGILSESKGPVWLIGTSVEHHALYQYHVVNAANHYMGLIQTETPYYQPDPASPSPFSVNTAYNDPAPYANSPSAWALSIINSNNILVFGAGLYSFFDNYSQTCLTPAVCQTQIVNVDTASTGVNIYSLSTVGTTFQISVNSAGVINQSGNVNGFASTVTSWSQS
ncbi:glycoside hydrolase family 55 protein [Hypholoma sublateritium FD-334 SS-4]|uniref:Glycoside hydrolase family 55 protein n=1 Tax=Hypholoma sublateritium (strain FD-334 SS-4) TaxID=945553 RepID=A0A0D2PDI0_HYPSF|nr:glycoside hydrolase family 55 protein [Hypholoma sublateritium FD-334 SS-4]